MWDQRYRVFAVSCSRRIIPTYVGSTQLNPQQLQTISNHSHVCGINYSVIPQARVLFRIIPTYVGSTSTEPLRIRTEPNHSHVCGINRRRLKPCSMAIESFPRMWDQLAIRGRFRRVKRIIPTYVGSTKSLVNRIAKTTNHSHVCGINSRNDCLTHSKNESFPRMWDQLLELLYGI